MIYFLKDHLHILKKSNGQRTEPCSIPTFMLAREECWPFKTTVEFLPITKSIKTRTIRVLG